jgi:hypothetical protein
MPNEPELLWIEAPPDFDIRDGIGHVRIVSGGKEIHLRCSPHTLLAGSVRAMQAYSRWDAAERPEPVPFKRD